MTTILTAMLVALGSTGAAFLAVAIISGESATATRIWRLYSGWAESKGRLLFLRRSPVTVAGLHALTVAVAASMGGLLGGWPLALLGGGAALVAGLRWPAHQLRKRRLRLEVQLEPTLRSVAQTLRVTSNLTDALETVAAQIDPPMSQEIDICLKQVRLGLPIEEALRQMGERADSPSLDTAATAIVIGRMTGGNLPALLEEVATTLRERVRLDGVIEAKTAEGRAQAWVMGLMPPSLAAMLWHLDRDLLAPLLSDPAGWAILGMVAVLEVVGVIWVRRVTAIEA